MTDAMEIQCSSCSKIWAYSGDADRAQCTGCKSRVDVPTGRVLRLRKNQAVRALAEGPVTDGNVRSSAPRGMANKLSAPVGNAGEGKRRGRTTNVYYLDGDEREAMRMFIEVNEEYVRDCMEDWRGQSGGSIPLTVNWADWKLQLLMEEWYLWFEPKPTAGTE